MSSVLSAGREPLESRVSDALLEYGVGTGGPTYLNEDVYETLYGKPFQTGHWECYLHGATYQVPGLGGKPESFWLCDRDGRTLVVDFVDPSNRQTMTRVANFGDLDLIQEVSANVVQFRATVPVLLDVGHVGNMLSSKLNQRIEQFRTDRLGEQETPESVVASVGNLLAWLCSQSTGVSATVSGDGMLSIATEFPNEIRLYVEVERDGTVGAAVTRERRYARDLEEHTLADLTPEVILAAVRSI